ncbi:MAG: sulfite exporter TauE/SafE family protein [Frankia sp.]|nr:sulfite exporter TauE/SafE family protein [Frankia sp.]
MLTTAAVAAAALVGATTQRITGLGFSLVTAPFLVLLLGPYAGVSLNNLLAALVAASTLATCWRLVDVERARVLVPAGLLGVLPGVLAARLLPAAPLQVLVGGLIIVGLLLTTSSPRARVRSTTPVHACAGLASGFMTATSGTGGPSLVLYSVATRWQQAAFAASAQVSFSTQAALAAALKGLPAVRPGALAAIILAAGGGLLLGGRLARHVPAVTARRLVIAISMTSAGATVVKGLLAL